LLTEFHHSKLVNYLQRQQFLNEFVLDEKNPKITTNGHSKFNSSRLIIDKHRFCKSNISFHKWSRRDINW
jgi:hypothetical protein